jgi:hypothetical protein
VFLLNVRKQIQPPLQSKEKENENATELTGGKVAVKGMIFCLSAEESSLRVGGEVRLRGVRITEGRRCFAHEWFQRGRNGQRLVGWRMRHIVDQQFPSTFSAVQESCSTVKMEATSELRFSLQHSL